MTLKPIELSEAAEKLFAEKSLTDIWKASNRIKRTSGNFVLLMLGIISLVGYAFLLPHTDASLVKAARTLVNLAFPAMLGLLGFLLAGLTIFVSGERRDILKAMALVESETSRLSVLKENIFAFIRPLIHLLAFSCLLLTALLFAEPDGGLVALVTRDSSGWAPYLVSRCGLIATGGLVVSGLIAVKSAIRNVYHLIMTSVGWELEQDRQAADSAKSDEPNGPATQ
jgi:hypothetical protein